MLRLKSNEYIHVEDMTTCEIFVLLGPLTYTLYDHLKPIQAAPLPCIVVPPGYYTTVYHPFFIETETESSAALASGDEVVVAATKEDSHHRSQRYSLTLLHAAPSHVGGVAAIQYSRFSSSTAMEHHSCLRFHDASPFPLLPGETVDAPRPMPRLCHHEALVLEAITPVADPYIPTRVRQPMEQYLFKGPAVYTPQLGEKVVRKITGRVLTETQHCFLVAKYAFVDDEGQHRVAGERWMAAATGIYFPNPATHMIVEEAVCLNSTTALVVEATSDFFDQRHGVARKAREQWLVTHDGVPAGYYLPSLHESVVQLTEMVHIGPDQYCIVANSPDAAGRPQWGRRDVWVGKQSFFKHPAVLCSPVYNSLVLDGTEALLVQAKQSFSDGDGVYHNGGQRWLISGPRRYIPDIHVSVLERRRIIALDENCGVYVRNINSGRIRSVFGQPFMLTADEELWERPVSCYLRRLLSAPRQSIRITEMTSQERREADIEYGRMHLLPEETDEMVGSSGLGGSNLLTEQTPESPASGSPTWTDSRDCSGHSDDADVASLLAEAKRNAEPPEQTRDVQRYAVVSTNAVHNTLMQIYDVSVGTSRIVPGPATIYLEPHEHFTTLLLSGGRPKQPRQIHSLSLYMGPDYMADVIDVETRDHARLRLHLAYNWEFDSQRVGGGSYEAFFTIPDFIGEACKMLASRMRSVVAGQTFEYFHRNSSSMIRHAIFSAAADGSTKMVGESLCFTANHLLISTVDVQSVEPVDAKTRSALTKSVQLAVEIITKSQESDASHQAALLEQEAKGSLELQVMTDRAMAEAQRMDFVRVMVENSALEQAGASRAQATAESAARLVEVEGELEATPMRCQSHAEGMSAELDILRERMKLDLAHRQVMNSLVVDKARRLAHLEASKYESIMATLGKEAVVAMAEAGPKLQSQLLNALGLQGLLVTDGKTPINLFSMVNSTLSPPPP